MAKEKRERSCTFKEVSRVAVHPSGIMGQHLRTWEVAAHRFDKSKCFFVLERERKGLLLQ